MSTVPSMQSHFARRSAHVPTRQVALVPTQLRGQYATEGAVGHSGVTERAKRPTLAHEESPTLQPHTKLRYCEIQIAIG